MLVKIELEIEVPDDIKDEDLSDWISHTYLNSGSISIDNPMFKLYPEPFNFMWSKR
jgi:hypothetical protein